MLALRLAAAEVRFTERADGDFSAAVRDERGAREQSIISRDWKTAKQVHGARVVVVDHATGIVGEADALVTRDPRVALAVRTADCAPVAFGSTEGIVAVAHAGWRGLLEGVLIATVATMRDLGAKQIEAALGPCIRAECYEFGIGDLDSIERRFGPVVRGETSAGHPALDVPAGVRAALAEVDIALSHDTGHCTACDSRWFSHRARQEPQRQATAVWVA